MKNLDTQMCAVDKLETILTVLIFKDMEEDTV